MESQIIKQICNECLNTELRSMAPDYPNMGECTKCGHPELINEDTNWEEWDNNQEPDYDNMAQRQSDADY